MAISPTIMFITASHNIDPDGDVDILLPDREELSSFVDDAWTEVSAAPGLGYRRSAAGYHWPNDEICEEAPPCEEPAVYQEVTAYEEPIEIPEPDEEVIPSADLPSEPVEEYLRPDEPQELQQCLDSEMDEHDVSPVSKEKCVRIRTSSKHLILASSHFKRNLQSGMLESQTLRSQGHVEFRIDEQNHEAMLIVLNIIHGKSRKVLRVVDLDMLTKIAVIVDYLDCLEVVEPYSDRWVDNLKSNLPANYSNTLVQWLCICLVFRKQTEFKAVTRSAIRLSRDAIQTLGLPIRESVVDKIKLRRYEALDQLLSALENLLDDFRHDRINCTFECNAMRYGALTKELSLRALLFFRPQIPFLGYSIEDTTASIREIRDPKWCSGNNSSRSFYRESCQSHACKLSTHIKQIIDSIEVNLKGFSLEDFPGGNGRPRS